MYLIKRLPLLLVCLISLLSIAGCQRAPNALDSHDKTISLAAYRGKWLVVNYWATWCAPCIKELPILNQLATTHSQKLAVLGVSFDTLSNEAINQFAKKLKLTFPQLKMFPAATFGITHIEALPITLIITPNGKLLTQLHGPQTAASILAVISQAPVAS